VSHIHKELWGPCEPCEEREARIAELEAELVAEKELRDYHGTEAASLRIERDRMAAVVEAARRVNAEAAYDAGLDTALAALEEEEA
jgi:hypothetical protein